MRRDDETKPGRDADPEAIDGTASARVSVHVPKPDAEPAAPTALGCALILAATALLQAAFWVIGTAVLIRPGNAQPLSPCQGVLIGLLLACPRSMWPWFALGALAGQTGAALALASAQAPPLLHAAYALIAVGEAVAGAVWLQQIFHGPELLLRMRNVIAFVILLAGICCAGAGLAMGLRVFTTGEGGFAGFQLWWMRDYLGMLLYTPIVVHLLQPTALPATFARIQRWETPLQLAFLVAVTQVAFTGEGAPANLGQVPYILYPVLVWIAFRAKPPALVLVALLIAGYGAFLHTSAGRGPFAHAHYTAFESLISAQIYVIVTTVTMLLLAAAVYERRRALLAAHASDERYRAFVRGSHDAIWRVEIDPPVPLAAPPDERAGRLRADARVAEHNDVYARIGGAGSRLPRPWREDAAWFGPCSELLAAGVPERGNIEAKLRIGGGDGRIVLCELHCFVEEGALRRVWGAAMDITAQERSQQELEARRAELSALASQLMRAEEDARRATAADLHDGIGQNLSAIIMWQGRVRENADEHERAELLEHIRAAAVESLQCTREIISDLSPPGLYDMGLDSALSALAARTRQRHALDVALERCELPPALGVDVKVTVFQCVRELLTNVVRHAHAHRARIDVRHDGRALLVTVADDGIGIDHPEALRARPSTHGGYGLLMIRERLVAMGGTLAVERSDAGGAAITITVPHAAN